MAELDADGNGSLSGEELRYVWVWVDANSDAIAQKGEIKPASSYVEFLSVIPELVGEDAHAPKGAMLSDGTIVKTWDWWSRCAFRNVYARFPYLDGVARWISPLWLNNNPVVPEEVSVYSWSISARHPSKGFLRFLRVGDDMYVFNSPLAPPIAHDNPNSGPYYELNYTKVVVGNDGALSWQFVGDRFTDSAVATLMPGSLSIVGENRFVHGSQDTGYRWVAELFPIDLVGSSPFDVRASFAALTSFSVGDFVAALAINPKAAGSLVVLVPSQEEKLPVKVVPLLE